MGFIRTILITCLGIIAFYFVMANISLMTRKSNWFVTSLGEVKGLSKPIMGDNMNPTRLEIEKYSSTIEDQNKPVCQQAQQQIINQFKMKNSPDSKVPELENFEDYAPPILSTNVVAPNYMKPRPVAQSNVPVAANMLATTQPSVFSSVRSSSHLDCTPSTDVGFFFSQDIAKSQIADPAQWERQAQKIRQN